MWFWILLGIFAAILLTVVAILRIPIDLMLKNDQKNKLIFSVKCLFWSFDGKSDKKPKGNGAKKPAKKKDEKENSFIDALKEATGLKKFENLKETIKEDGFGETVSKTCSVVVDLFKEVGGLVKHSKAKRFSIHIVCAEDDAADTAINYGRCCSLVYPIVGYLGCYMKIPKRVRDIDISCDYSGQNGAFLYDFIVRVRLGSVLVAAVKIVAKRVLATLEAKRAEEAKNLPPTPTARPKKRK